MVARTKSPVCVLGHSMGNRTLDYFFRFVHAMPDGQEWLDTHIYSWIAVGAPLLGAPKAFRGVVISQPTPKRYYTHQQCSYRYLGMLSVWKHLLLFKRRFNLHAE